MKRSVFVLVIVCSSLAGCRETVKSARPPQSELQRPRELTDEQAVYLDRLAAAADAHPDDFDARKASGLAHMRFTLSGVTSLQERAERDLEAAFALDPTDPLLNRSLGRFYNMRAVAGDDSKAAMQVKVYQALLGDTPVEQMDTQAFVAWSFFQLGRVLSQKNDGRLLAALGTVGDLEEELARRARAHPDDIELWALAGNFAFFFAGNVPFGKKDRVEAAVAYFEHVRAHWDQMRPGAKDPDHCPNTWENFMFELAEGYTVLGRRDEAVEIYRELTSIQPPRTRAKEQIAWVAAERLRNLESYVDEMELMPPWPSDVANCVVCHSWTSDVSLATLHTVEPMTLEQIPSRALPKPIDTVTVVPASVRSVVERRCRPCHFEGGESRHLADFSSDEGILSHARAAVRRVSEGSMPPERPLCEDEQTLLRQWLQE